MDYSFGIDYLDDRWGTKYQLRYIFSNPLISNPYGMSRPCVTQCMLYVNGLFVNSATIVKHRNDPVDFCYAIRLASKRAMAGMPIKVSGDGLWKLILAKSKEFDKAGRWRI